MSLCANNKPKNKVEKYPSAKNANWTRDKYLIPEENCNLSRGIGRSNPSKYIAVSGFLRIQKILSGVSQNRDSGKKLLN